MGVEELIGKTFSSVVNKNDEELVFTGERSFKLYHWQDCCETVEIAEIIGDLNDLVDTPILAAEERSEEGPEDNWYTSTWTFYEFRTIKGSVTIRWVGESNGCYSESVDFKEITN